jgi:upstream activation factor subunit UAF30
MYPAEAGAGETDNLTMADLGAVTPMRKKPAHLAASQASIASSSPAVPLMDDANKKKRKREADASVDEDLARKLHQSLNEERSTRGTASGGKRKKNVSSESSKGKKSRVKSKAIVDDDDDDGSGSASDDGKGKKKRSKVAKTADGTPGAAKGGFSKPMILR